MESLWTYYGLAMELCIIYPILNAIESKFLKLYNPYDFGNYILDYTEKNDSRAI